MAGTLIALRHVEFEDLDGLEAVFADRGFALDYRDAPSGEFNGADDADLLVVLGGPFAAYDVERHGFLAAERQLIERRLATSRPILGICLGAQLIASALGARNYAGPQAEIGWSALRLAESDGANLLAPLAGHPVLHWHGDTFDLPDGAVWLAATDAFANQAFSYGPAVLGLQFHLEVTATGFERWLAGHGDELRREAIDPETLRAAARRHAPPLAAVTRRIIGEWIDGWSMLGETSSM